MPDKTLSFDEKLLAVQKEVGPIKKDSDNPYFKSKYFDINGLLAVLKPCLNKYGLLVLQPLTELNGSPALALIVMDVENGKELKTVCPIPRGIDPQKDGSAITYYRRYALQSFFALEAEDDDGNASSGKSAGKAPTRSKYGSGLQKKLEENDALPDGDDTPELKPTKDDF